MSKQKKYKKTDIERIIEHLEKDENDSIWEVYIVDNRPASLRTSDVVAMLRQAADAEEELAKVKASKDRWMQYQETASGERNACIDELRKKDAENAQLKAQMKAVSDDLSFTQDAYAKATARLEAVVKLMEIKECMFSCENCARNILRVARGESETENK